MRRIIILSAVLFATGCCHAPQARLLKTNQTQCDQGSAMLGACPGSPAQQDAALGKGVARSYTDNGETITDNRTGLVWEKIDNNNAGGIHDVDNTYKWVEAFNDKIATLNSTNFAGHNDWRLPNVEELQTLADYSRHDPAIDTVFNTACAPGCTVPVCSCTSTSSASDYWTSTTYQEAGNTTSDVWFIRFANGEVYAAGKGGNHLRARAVRGGP